MSVWTDTMRHNDGRSWALNRVEPCLQGDIINGPALNDVVRWKGVHYAVASTVSKWQVSKLYAVRIWGTSKE